MEERSGSMVGSGWGGFYGGRSVGIVSRVLEWIEVGVLRERDGNRVWVFSAFVLNGED